MANMKGIHSNMVQGKYEIPFNINVIMTEEKGRLILFIYLFFFLIKHPSGENHLYNRNMGQQTKETT